MTGFVLAKGLIRCHGIRVRLSAYKKIVLRRSIYNLIYIKSCHTMIHIHIRIRHCIHMHMHMHMAYAYQCRIDIYPAAYTYTLKKSALNNPPNPLSVTAAAAAD
jgi:hypothetical protein